MAIQPSAATGIATANNEYTGGRLTNRDGVHEPGGVRSDTPTCVLGVANCGEQRNWLPQRCLLDVGGCKRRTVRTGSALPEQSRPCGVALRHALPARESNVVHGLRFRSLEEIGYNAPLAAVTLRLLGDHNDTLVHLGIEGAVVRDAHVLQCYSALNSLSLGHVDHVTVSVFVHMLENVLETLSLNDICDLRVESLARCPALRELSIGYGDYRVPVGNRLNDASPLEHCYSLRVLTMVNVPLSYTHTAVLARVAARGQVVITVDGRDMFGAESPSDDDQHLDSSTAS
jgi:hypothetical protein